MTAPGNRIMNSFTSFLVFLFLISRHFSHIYANTTGIEITLLYNLKNRHSIEPKEQPQLPKFILSSPNTVFSERIGMHFPYHNNYDGSGMYDGDNDDDEPFQFEPHDRRPVLSDQEKQMEDESEVLKNKHHVDDARVSEIEPPKVTDHLENEMVERFYKDVNKHRLQEKLQVYPIDDVQIHKTVAEPDLEHIDKLMTELNDNSKNKLVILEDIEYLVHKYSVAVHFAKKEGINIMLSLLNSSDYSLVSASAVVLGSAMQGNPFVQLIAQVSNVGDYLTRMIHHNSSIVQSRILYALSCYLRQSPAAQRAFISAEGFGKLADILHNNTVSRKLKMKVINLVNDLVIEHQMAKIHVDESDSGSTAKYNIYNSIPLEQNLKENQFCILVPELLFEDDFDTLQKVVSAMNAMLPFCKPSFNDRGVFKRIQNLLELHFPESSSQEISSLWTIDKELNNALYRELTALYDGIRSKHNDKKPKKDEL